MPKEEKDKEKNATFKPPPELREELALLDSMIRYLLQIRIDITVLSEQHQKGIPNLLTLEKLESAHSALLFLFFMMRGTRIATETEKGKDVEGVLEEMLQLKNATDKDEKDKEKEKRGYA